MLKNKARAVSTRQHKKPRELPGPLSRTWTPAVRDNGLRAHDVLARTSHNLWRRPPPSQWKSWIRPCLLLLKARVPLYEFEQDVCRNFCLDILLGDFFNQFMALLDTSWRFLNGRKGPRTSEKSWNMFKKFVTLWQVLPVLEHFLVLLDNVSAASWWFLDYSWLDLAVLGESGGKKFGVNQQRARQVIVKRIHEAVKMLSRSCQEHVTKS